MTRSVYTGLFTVALVMGSTTARGADPEAAAASNGAASNGAASNGAASNGAAQATAALDELDQWLGNGANGDKWRTYLRTAELRRELDNGADVDPAALARAIQPFRGGAPGLELAPMVKARTALERRLGEVKQAYAGDPAKLAWASRGDYQPFSAAEFAKIRKAMQDAASELERALGGDTPLAAGWKKHLHWEALEPHLTGPPKSDRQALAQLDDVLRRFHTNSPGLELPVFTNAAKAIARYRGVVTWATAAASANLAANYERLVEAMSRQVANHLQRPTSETAWKIGRVLGVVDGLGRSPQLVRELRKRFAQPNIKGMVSANFIRKLPNRPINQTKPVRDCILGTSIFGSAHTTGSVRYELQPSTDSIELTVYLNGQALSNTRGFNGPAKINASGRTEFWAVKPLSLNDDRFTSGPASASADTRTRIRSISKTGGRFGHRLVEKIAWKRAMEQKRQSERIAARHAEQRVINELEETVANDLAKQRARYDAEVRAPLVRRGIKPEYLRMSSGAAGVMAETIFAGRNQLAALGPPPRPMGVHDLTLQVHESAVNNYMPLALATARISRQTPDRPADLEGDVPNWLKLMAVSKPSLAAAANAGVEAVEQAADKIEELVGAEEDVKTPPFRAYSVTLNSEAPISARFDDGKIIVRVRAAELVSEDSEYKNWDFIVSYKITTDGNRIVLQRVGDIEVFPTGFDPGWDQQLTAQQTAFRNTLAGNMNARAKAGDSFPAEIPILPLRITRFGVMVLQELVSDDGWLTVGWALPPPGSPAE